MINIPTQVRKNSWWTSGSSTNKRNFVVVELYHDWDDAGTIDYHIIGLLEHAFDYPIYLDVEEFVRLFEAGELVPVNTLPVLPKGHQRPPQPDFTKYISPSTSSQQ